MKKILAIVFCLLLISIPAFAANHYILDGGTGDGSAWNNAWDQVPTTLTRGDTYYLGVGTYTGFVIDDEVSGTNVITIKKATVADHGTETGWDAAYAGQAVFQNATSSPLHTLYIPVSYVTVEGAVGSGSDPDTYGFKVLYPADGLTAGNYVAIRLGMSSDNNSNVKIYHTAIVGPGELDCLYNQTDTGLAYTCCNSGIQHSAATGAFTAGDFSNDYFYGWMDQITLNYNTSSTIVHDNFFSSNSSAMDGGNAGHPAWRGYCHGEQLTLDHSDGISFYNNIFYNSRTFILGAHGNIGSNTGLKMYNNVSYGNQDSALAGCFANGGSGAADVILGGDFYNNTFLDINCGGDGAIFVGNLTDVATDHSHAYNNLFYNVAYPAMNNGAPTFTSGGVVHDYNAYLKCAGTINNADEAHPQVDSDATDPFTDSVNGDYTLKSGTLPIDHGKTLAAPYDTDYAGTDRPKGAAFDIGAYELDAALDLIVTFTTTSPCTAPAAVVVASGDPATGTLTVPSGYKHGTTSSGTWSGNTVTTAAITADTEVTLGCETIKIGGVR